jgi:hypothetical protein
MCWCGEADADLENFRRVRPAVVPHERGADRRGDARRGRPDTAHLLEFVTVTQRPELWDVAYERVGPQGFADMALTAPL